MVVENLKFQPQALLSRSRLGISPSSSDLPAFFQLQLQLLLLLHSTRQRQQHELPLQDDGTVVHCSHSFLSVSSKHLLPTTADLSSLPLKATADDNC